MISCVTKTSACYHTLHANHWHCLWKIPPIIAVKSNVTTFIRVLRLAVNMFYCGRVVLPYLNTLILKAWRSASWTQCPLATGIVRRQFPSLGALRDVTIGRARETALASSTYAPFTWRLLTFTGKNWKCHVIIVIKTNLLGFVVTMHPGLCVKSVKLTSYFARALVHCDNKPLQNRS